MLARRREGAQRSRARAYSLGRMPKTQRPQEPRLRAAKLPVPLHIVLVEPEIPPNTGNIARLAAANGLTVYSSWARSAFASTSRACGAPASTTGTSWTSASTSTFPTSSTRSRRSRLPARSTFFSAIARKSYLEPAYAPGDALVFGRESVGLPRDMLAANEDRVVGIPTLGAVRSLNIANAAGIKGSHEALPPHRVDAP